MDDRIAQRDVLDIDLCNFWQECEQAVELHRGLKAPDLCPLDAFKGERSPEKSSRAGGGRGLEAPFDSTIRAVWASFCPTMRAVYACLAEGVNEFAPRLSSPVPLPRLPHGKGISQSL